MKNEPIESAKGEMKTFVRQARFWLAFLAEVLLLASLHRFDDWRYAEMPIKFVQVALLCGLSFYLAASSFRLLPAARVATITFWLGAILLRLIALPLEPADDVWRYQWEGQVINAGFNPYLLAPNDEKLVPMRAPDPDWNRINHRNESATYPPGAELIFAALSRAGASTLIYKLLCAAVDLGSIALLLRLIGGPSRYLDAIWYAWNPLVVYSFAGAAHFDCLMILPMLAGILFFARSIDATETSARWCYAIFGAAALGFAISIDLVPLLLLPICAFALRRRAWSLAISVAIPAAISLPFGFPRVPIWSSLGRSTYLTRLNDMFWWTIEETVWPNPHQKNYHYSIIVAVAVVIVALIFFRNWKRGVLWSLGTALFLSPVLHPWYCTWILPFAAWRRARAWQVLSISIFAYYLFGDERLFDLPWHSEPWLRAIIYLPPIAALLWSSRQNISLTNEGKAPS